MALHLHQKNAAHQRPQCHEPPPNDRCSFIEFRRTPTNRQGFALSQLLHYTIEPAPTDEEPQRERLIFGFSTADVILHGLRLVRLVDLFHQHRLGAVWPFADRYANMDPHDAFVSSIDIERLDKPKPDQPASSFEDKGPVRTTLGVDEGNNASLPTRKH